MTALQAAQAGAGARHEARELGLVVARLRDRFPDLDGEEIRTLVEQRQAEFVGSRVRTFIPLLVERSVREVCEGVRAVTLRPVGAEGVGP